MSVALEEWNNITKMGSSNALLIHNNWKIFNKLDSTLLFSGGTTVINK